MGMPSKTSSRRLNNQCFFLLLLFFLVTLSVMLGVGKNRGKAMLGAWMHVKLSHTITSGALHGQEQGIVHIRC